MATNYISLAACEDRCLYRIDSRNLAFGVFAASCNGFIGIRQKFDERYLFTEYHWDTGPPFGTVRPLEVCGRLPVEIELSESLGTYDGRTGREVRFDKPVADGGRGWYYTDTGEADDKIRAIGRQNHVLFAWLERLEGSIC